MTDEILEKSLHYGQTSDRETEHGECRCAETSDITGRGKSCGLFVVHGIDNPEQQQGQLPGH